jgi:hypothetical protein
MSSEMQLNNCCNATNGVLYMPLKELAEYKVLCLSTFKPFARLLACCDVMLVYVIEAAASL